MAKAALRSGLAGQVPNTPTMNKAQELEDDLESLLQTAEAEIEEIEEQAREFGGKPKQSIRYLYATEAKSMAYTLLQLIRGHHSFVRSASAGDIDGALHEG